ncbi:hypothetical protein UFOVP699_296 [uncultured Caudovirales phage]|uniref:Uncharacterized protein n=1 Tax=uncultured Caudovirales phage TaxID=2100421 RepID=A0A6J5NID1_9CAUD|nr:hypothetical protein UFOVP699_296 [uncultured Caudovirales phage]
MGMILDFGNWRKLHEAEEAEMAMDVSASGPNPYTNLKNNAKGVYSAVKSILSRKDAAAFWQLSNAVGGILKAIGPLDLEKSQRSEIAYGVAMTLDSSKYGNTIDMFSKWAESTGWESFVNLFKEESGKPLSLTHDLDQDFKMPRDTGAKWNLD